MGIFVSIGGVGVDGGECVYVCVFLRVLVVPENFNIQT